MWISTDEAAEIYARFCQARYGQQAIAIIRQRAAELGRRGDPEGERIWTIVAEKVMQAQPRLHSAA